MLNISHGQTLSGLIRQGHFLYRTYLSVNKIIIDTDYDYMEKYML